MIHGYSNLHFHRGHHHDRPPGPWYPGPPGPPPPPWRPGPPGPPPPPWRPGPPGPPPPPWVKPPHDCCPDQRPWRW